MVESPILAAFLAWADRQSSIRVVTLFGSLARGAGTPSSDVDLQIVTSRPEQFETGEWSKELNGLKLSAYALRPATGGVKKATGLFDAGEMDLVVVPWVRLSLARACVSAGVHRWIPGARRALAPMVLILRPGFRVLRGGEGWRTFYQRTIDEVPDPRLDDAEVRSLGEMAYVDAAWIAKKTLQGERVAAQRWLHRTPVEINLRLLNEWRLRRGEPPCFDGRRAERVLPADQLAAISVNASLDTDALLQAARHCIATSRWLVTELTGSPPTWPDV